MNPIRRQKNQLVTFQYYFVRLWPVSGLCFRTLSKHDLSIEQPSTLYDRATKYCTSNQVETYGIKSEADGHTTQRKHQIFPALLCFADKSASVIYQQTSGQPAVVPKRQDELDFRFKPVYESGRRNLIGHCGVFCGLLCMDLNHAAAILNPGI